MKVALVTGGQPRFTEDFINLMNQLSGFDHADIYMSLWESDWATDKIHARSKIEKILQSRYSLAKVEIVKEPAYELPPHPVPLESARPENIRWWYDRMMSQLSSLTMAFDLIDQHYDAVVRFRLDGRLENNLDLSTLDLVTTDLIFPSYPRHGFDDYQICDQFAVGTQAGMKFYCSLSKEFKDLVPIADPQWFTRGGVAGWTWGTEHVLGTYMKKYNRVQTCGSFRHTFNTRGRSRYTDKHYHHPIVIDPTEI